MFSRRKSDLSKQYPILSNKPVEINNPKRKARLIIAAWVVALVMCSVAGAYIAATIAIEQNDHVKAQLQAELERRTKERDAQADRFQHALDQYRIDQCRITARLPQDPDVVEIRTRYRCANQVVAPPTPTLSPAAVPDPAGPGSGIPTSLRPGRRQPAPPPPVIERPVAGPIPAPPVVPPLPSPVRQCVAPLCVRLTLEP